MCVLRSLHTEITNTERTLKSCPWRDFAAQVCLDRIIHFPSYWNNNELAVKNTGCSWATSHGLKFAVNLTCGFPNKCVWLSGPRDDLTKCQLLLGDLGSWWKLPRILWCLWRCDRWTQRGNAIRVAGEDTHSVPDFWLSTAWQALHHRCFEKGVWTAACLRKKICFLGNQVFYSWRLCTNISSPESLVCARGSIHCPRMTWTQKIRTSGRWRMVSWPSRWSCEWICYYWTTDTVTVTRCSRSFLNLRR